MTIKVLGPECMNCKTLERRTLDALGQMNVKANVEKVTDLDGIASYAVMRTPGLVIDGEMKSLGNVPTDAQLLQWLKD